MTGVNICNVPRTVPGRLAGPTAPFPGDLQVAMAILPSNAVPVLLTPPGQGSTAPCEDPLSFILTFAFQTYLAGWAFCGYKMDTLVVSSPESLPDGSKRGRHSLRWSLSGDG